MAPTLVRLYLRRSLRRTRHVKAVPTRAARGLVAEVYRQVERDFGMMAPPVGLHSPSPEALAASWLILRETLVARGHVDRASKELVATSVSAANRCPYCEDVHGTTAAGLVAAEDRRDNAERERIEAWVKETATAGTADNLPFTAVQAPEIIGTAVAFHYYNRMVNVFLGDSPLPPHVPEAARPRARRVLSWILRPSGGGPRAGTSLRLLPAARQPDELCWARANPIVADAFARAYAALDAAGERSVPASVRDLVLRHLRAWDGEPPGISRSWVDEATAELSEADQAVGRFALVVALAAYQVDDGLVAAVRRAGAGDRELVEVAAWASMAAARRVSTWLAAGSSACG